jgi:hypothetical protein
MTGTLEEWGFIPSFLHADDPRPAAEQFNERYIGGWQNFPGLTFNRDDITLSYPGDPVMKALSALVFRNEVLLLFPSSWVVIVQDDHSWEACRMD